MRILTISAEGEREERTMTAEEIASLPKASASDELAAITAALQDCMDKKAKALGYDDIKTAITYRGDPNPKFAAEAEALFAYRSAVWTEAYSLLASVQAGTAQFPTIAEAIAMMPQLTI
jgi:hypothetical protein